MILVRLYTRKADLLTEVGRLEFYGVPLPKPNGSTWSEFDALNEPHPGQVRLVPTGIATPAAIRTIHQAVSRNEVRGRTGRYEWRVE
jgi:hypothetical protein